MKTLLKKSFLFLLTLCCVAVAACNDTDGEKIGGQEFGPFNPAEQTQDYVEDKRLVFVAQGEEGAVQIACEGITAATFNGESVSFTQTGISLDKAALYQKLGDNYLEYETPDCKYKTLVEVITTSTDFENGQLSSVLAMDHTSTVASVPLKLALVGGGKMEGEYCVGNDAHANIRITATISKEYLDWAFLAYGADSVTFDVAAGCALNHYTFGSGNVNVYADPPEAVDGLYRYTVTIAKEKYVGSAITFTAYGIKAGTAEKHEDNPYTQINEFYFDNFKINKAEA